MSHMTPCELQEMTGDGKEAFSLAIQTSQANALTNSDKITAHAYWWGFHIAIPEGPLKKMETATDVGKVITGAVGVGFGIAGIPPVAVCIGILVAVWGVESIAIKAADHGKGVYLSWIWPQVPFAVVPPYVQSLPLPTAI